MKKVLTGMLAVAGLMVVAPAMAATSWTTTGNSSTSGSFGNSRQFLGNDGTTTVTATAWANTGSGGTLETAYLGAYGGGLGVTNRFEGSGGSDMHTADNSGSQDMIALAFNEAVKLDQVRNGYWVNDSDLSILAYTGAGNPSLGGTTYASLLLNGWVSIGNLSNPGTSLTNTGATQYSSHWLIGAANSLFGSVDSKTDWVKLKKLVGTICTAPGGASGGVCGGQPGTGVSEPGSLALAGLGLLGVIGLRRRQH